jgi:hypothetical protein
MVSGDRVPLCEEPLELEDEVELFAVKMLVGSNVVVVFCVKPVAGVAEDFCVVSDCNSSSADEAAASIMTKLLDMPQPARPQFPAFCSASRVPKKKP